MQQSSDLYFASSNIHKFKEVKKILNTFGINIKFFNCKLKEIQSDSLTEIANNKAKQAFLMCRKPVLVEDDGLFIDILNGFPGPYSSYVFSTIGNKGILKLLKQNRKAKFVSIICFCDKKNTKTFESTLRGTISKQTFGRGWGYDPIFIPLNEKKTFAQLEDKNEKSHRFKSLKNFSSWYLDM